MILGIDLGEKKSGIAVLYPENDVVIPRKAIRHSSENDCIKAILSIVGTEEVEKIVIGKPIGLSGNNTEQTRTTLDFKEKLQKNLDIPIVLIDERLSTKHAQQFFDEKLTADEDSLAACAILESYRDQYK